MTAQGWSWKLVFLPLIAVIDLIAVTLYGAGALDVTDLGPGIRIFDVVLVGLAVFLLLLIIELLMLWRTFKTDAEAEDELESAEAEAAEEDHWEEEAEPVEDVAAMEPQDDVPDFDLITTADHYDGRRVLEMARPPKSSVAGGIYASTYVAVNGEYALRLEDLIAYQQG